MWIEFFHPRGDAGVIEVVRERILADALVGIGLVRIEVCRGASDRRAFDRLNTQLKALRELDLDRVVVDRAADIGWKLQRAGRRVPVVDSLLAAAAMVHDAELWHLGDAHFAAISEVEPLVRQRSFSRAK